jgi:hypothetical protein
MPLPKMYITQGATEYLILKIFASISLLFANFDSWHFEWFLRVNSTAITASALTFMHRNHLKLFFLRFCIGFMQFIDRITYTLKFVDETYFNMWQDQGLIMKRLFSLRPALPGGLLANICQKSRLTSRFRPNKVVPWGKRRPGKDSSQIFFKGRASPKAENNLTRDLVVETEVVSINTTALCQQVCNYLLREAGDFNARLRHKLTFDRMWRRSSSNARLSMWGRF